MKIDETILDKVEQLDRLAMVYETAAIPFEPGGCLGEFYDFYQIKGRGARLVPSPEPFRGRLRELSGYDRWAPIADEAERLFGTPARVLEFDDDSTVRDELEGPDGLAPFFFVFDVMFCEYEAFTLCLMSGTNN